MSTLTTPYSLIELPDSQKYTLKSYKSMETSDGVAFTANLYRGSKHVGYVEDQGRGGALNFSFSAVKDNEASREEGRLFDEWVAKIKPEGNDGFSWMFNYGMDAEMAMNMLVAEVQMQKMISATRNLVLADSRETVQDGEFSTISRVKKFSPSFRPMIEKDMGLEALYFDRETKSWKKVSEAV